MKKLFIVLFALSSFQSMAQEQKNNPAQICVSGEGKIKTRPDQAIINIAIESKGAKAVDVKKENDIAVDKVLQFIKKMKIPSEDVMTQNVSLNSNYDYEKKKHNYMATQTISIQLKDLSQYAELSAGLVDAGVNRIDNVEFKSSKLKSLQSEARKMAIKDAKGKAEDYVSALGQKMGKAILVNDNSQANYPMPMYKNMTAMSMADGAQSQAETIAIGEIEIVANVSVCFALD
jgi:hypothetical protein